MTHPSIEVSVGSYFQAAVLSKEFNLRGKYGSEMKTVSHVLDKAVDLLLEIAPQIKEGWVLSVREPKPYVSYPKQDILSTSNLSDVASQYMPGDALGRILVDARMTTVSRLNTIKNILGLPTTIQAARVAIDIYSRMNANQETAQYYIYNSRNGAEKKEIVSYKLAKGSAL